MTPTPELPEEIFAIRRPDGYFEGTITENAVYVFTSQSEAIAQNAGWIDADTRTVVLFGVNPRHREAIDRINNVLATLAGQPFCNARNLGALESIGEIVAGCKAGRVESPTSTEAGE